LLNNLQLRYRKQSSSAMICTVTATLFALCVLAGGTETAAFVVHGSKTFITLLAATRDNEPGQKMTRPVPGGGPQRVPGGTSLRNAASKMLAADKMFTKEAWKDMTPTIVQGSSLRTFQTQVNRVQLLMKTEGRPLHSTIELWHGPDYTPLNLKIYIENAELTPFNCILDTPYQNTVAVYNTGPTEFPMAACVLPEQNNALQDMKDRLFEMGNPIIIQGGALRTFNFDPFVSSVQVMLTTDGRHLTSRIEILQGPNNNKQVIEVYSSDGKKRPFFAVFETPEAGCVIRIVNKQSVEYPLTVSVTPHMVGVRSDASERK
jgi:hypothetical protein